MKWLWHPSLLVAFVSGELLPVTLNVFATNTGPSSNVYEYISARAWPWPRCRPPASVLEKGGEWR